MGFRPGMFPPITVTVLVASCAVQDSTGADAKRAAFAHDLSVCRFQHTGATNQKLALKPTQVHIAQSLARRGWSPAGKRLAPGHYVILLANHLTRQPWAEIQACGKDDDRTWVGSRLDWAEPALRCCF